MENAPIIHEGDEEAREVALDNQEGLDNLSNGLFEGDPLLNEENEDPSSSSDSSSNLTGKKSQMGGNQIGLALIRRIQVFHKISLRILAVFLIIFLYSLIMRFWIWL